MSSNIKRLFVVFPLASAFAFFGVTNVSAFTTDVSSSLDSNSGIVYGGTTVGANFKISVKDGGTTPQRTKAQYVWFLIRDGYKLDNGTYTNNDFRGTWSDSQWSSLSNTLSENKNFQRTLAYNTGDGYKHAKYGLCEYYWEFTGGAITDGYGCYPYSDNQWITRGGNSILAECHQFEMREEKDIPLGTAPISSGTNLEKSVPITIPDVKAGYKFCVATGINFTDSTDSDRYRWHISGASCATIAKKPNFEAWNGGVYAPSGISTSTISKTANAGNTSTGEASGRLFGSWAEYYVVANGRVTGFSSAAGLGFAQNNMNTTGSGSSADGYCQRSRLTIGNYDCNDGDEAGNYGGKNINIESYVDALKTKYRAGVNGVESYEGDVYISQKTPNVSAASIVQISSPQTGTRVIRTTGDVYINQDICIFGTPSSTGCANMGQYENYLGLAADEGNSYSSAIDIPQVLIMARNIYIAENVTQIDAWLITEKGGEINTCGTSSLVTSSASCWKTLKVNGPVYTSKLSLTRTGGSWPGLYGDIGNPNESLNLYYGGGAREGNKTTRDLTCDGSVTPAEIFNLHPMSMLWAFYQENALSRAYVTSMQEFSPRY